MEENKKSGASAFVEWVFGVILAIAFFHYVDTDTHQLETLRNLVNILCFTLITAGALLKQQHYKLLKPLGHGIISLAIVLLGVGAVLLIKTYKGN